MLTQSLSTTVIGHKISPVAYPAPALDQFGAVTGHAGLVATEFSSRRTRKSTARTSLRNTFIR